jgi:hypothetical protein
MGTSIVCGSVTKKQLSHCVTDMTNTRKPQVCHQFRNKFIIVKQSVSQAGLKTGYVIRIVPPQKRTQSVPTA